MRTLECAPWSTLSCRLSKCSPHALPRKRRLEDLLHSFDGITDAVLRCVSAEQQSANQVIHCCARLRGSSAGGGPAHATSRKRAAGPAPRDLSLNDKLSVLVATMMLLPVRGISPHADTSAQREPGSRAAVQDAAQGLQQHLRCACRRGGPRSVGASERAAHDSLRFPCAFLAAGWLVPVQDFSTTLNSSSTGAAPPDVW